MPPTPGIALDESNYLERLDIYHSKLWPTLNEFVCPACGDSVEPFLGVLIKSCKIHKFCRACLRQAAVDSPWLEVDCPLSADCGGTLDEGELRELLSPHPDAYRVYLSKRARHVVENDLAQLQPFLYDSRIMTNLVEFECPICMEPIAPLAGVSTRTCQVHYFCRDCMIGAIRSCDDPRPRCPAVGCDACLPDAEVEELAPEEHRRLLNLGVERAIAAAGRGAFHCMVPDCNGMWFVEGQAEGRIDCPLCGLVNCLTCKVVHRYGQSCDEYRQRLEDTRTREQNAESEIQSQRYIEKMIRDHKGMLCPRCEALVTKMSGCDALVCLSCTMELCWATRGPRWGPKGRGDTTGGCGCRVKGRLCHPRCQNCH